MGLAQSTVSRHLACLRDCGLVESRPQGRASLFSLTQPELVVKVLAAAEELLASTGDAVVLCARSTASGRRRGRTVSSHTHATGRSLGSRDVVADSTQTLLCTYLSAVLLAGLVLNATLGWAWADPVAGLVIAAVAVKEGLGPGVGKAAPAVRHRLTSISTPLMPWRHRRAAPVGAARDPSRDLVRQPRHQLPRWTTSATGVRPRLSDGDNVSGARWPMVIAPMGL